MSITIASALAIANAVGLDDWIKNKLQGSDSGAAKLADKVLDIAMLTAKEIDAPTAINKLKSSSQLASDFRVAVRREEHELLKLAFADLSNARDMYKHSNEQADKIAERIMLYNPIYILLCVVIQGLAVYCLQDHATLLSMLTTLITLAIKSFIDQMSQVNGFFFSSSLGSRRKDELKERN